MKIHATVSGCSVDTAGLSYRDHGFGKSIERPLQYKIHLPADLVIERMCADIDAFVALCKREDERFGEVAISRLKALGYPTCHELIARNQELLAEIVRDFLYFELLEAVLGNPLTPSYVINSIDHVIIEPDGFVLEGEAFSI